uniref:Myb-like domain-containing protein n=1 Tax=Macrostomum lignano TaxID=282301 RepID=A0A1I8JM19_9PLAT
APLPPRFDSLRSTSRTFRQQGESSLRTSARCALVLDVNRRVQQLFLLPPRAASRSTQVASFEDLDAHGRRLFVGPRSRFAIHAAAAAAAAATSSFDEDRQHSVWQAKLRSSGLASLQMPNLGQMLAKGSGLRRTASWRAVIEDCEELCEGKLDNSIAQARPPLNTWTAGENMSGCLTHGTGFTPTERILGVLAMVTKVGHFPDIACRVGWQRAAEKVGGLCQLYEQVTVAALRRRPPPSRVINSPLGLGFACLSSGRQDSSRLRRRPDAGAVLTQEAACCLSEHAWCSHTGAVSYSAQHLPGQRGRTYRSRFGSWGSEMGRASGTQPSDSRLIDFRPYFAAGGGDTAATRPMSSDRRGPVAPQTQNRRRPQSSSVLGFYRQMWAPAWNGVDGAEPFAATFIGQHLTPGR